MLLRPLVPLCLISALAAQSEVLYYKFDGGGAKALNYAAAGGPAPAEGVITNTLTTAPLDSFVAGRFGKALQGGSAVTPYQANSVATGWAPNVTGSYTWAMWMYNSRGNAGPGLTYVAGIPVSGQFRIYGGSSILLTVGGAGGSTYYATTANIYAMATAGWVHVAFVVDTSNMTATYYVNGVAEVPLTLTALPSIVGADFNIGRQATNAPSIYDIDEFRFLTRAATAGEIAVWSTANGAGDVAFGQGCDATMVSTNGPPQLGNVNYGLTATGAVPGVGFLMIGVSRTNVGPLTLPFDLGLVIPPMTGCQWESSGEVSLLVVLGGGGVGTQALPIPSNPALDGLTLYAQGLFVGGPRTMMSTNPVAIGVGN